MDSTTRRVSRQCQGAGIHHDRARRREPARVHGHGEVGRRHQRAHRETHGRRRGGPPPCEVAARTPQPTRPTPCWRCGILFESHENPLGEGGEQLHDWVVELKSWREPHGMEGGVVNASSAVVEESLANVDAEIMGRGKFGPPEGGPWGDDSWRGVVG